MRQEWDRRSFLAVTGAGTLAAAVSPAAEQKRNEVIISQPADAVTLVQPLVSHVPRRLPNDRR